ncbi:MAG TPA: 6-phosphogluconolactonase [Rhodocyclaceae bacterium]|nr:6-phosphogluconolactonase [Rhodocyclaceae bacterium]
MPTVNPNDDIQQSNSHIHWHVFDSVQALEDAALNHILAAAHDAIATRGAFHIVLAGGTTPRHVYESLRSMKADWTHWHVWFGDERCLPEVHPERNSRMAMEAWLAHVPIPFRQIHEIHAEAGAEAAAHDYADALREISCFDFVLLGLGEDGHTASLFPIQEWERAIAWPSVLPVHDAPKAPPDRVSLSPDRLSATRAVLFLVTGGGKANAVRDWRDGIPIPASRIKAPRVDIYLDHEAAVFAE